MNPTFLPSAPHDPFYFIRADLGYTPFFAQQARQNFGQRYRRAVPFELTPRHLVVLLRQPLTEVLPGLFADPRVAKRLFFVQAAVAPGGGDRIHLALADQLPGYRAAQANDGPLLAEVRQVLEAARLAQLN